MHTNTNTTYFTCNRNSSASHSNNFVETHTHTNNCNVQILPNRVRSIGEWMRKVKYDGSVEKAVLKDRADKAGADRFVKS